MTMAEQPQPKKLYGNAARVDTPEIPAKKIAVSHHGIQVRYCVLADKAADTRSILSIPSSSNFFKNKSLGIIPAKKELDVKLTIKPASTTADVLNNTLLLTLENTVSAITSSALISIRMVPYMEATITMIAGLTILVAPPRLQRFKKISLKPSSAMPALPATVNPL